jgi:hypothetical protein
MTAKLSQWRNPERTNRPKVAITCLRTFALVLKKEIGADC